MKHAAARLIFSDGTADTPNELRQQVVIATRAARACAQAGLDDSASSCWQYAKASWAVLERRGAAAACATDGVRMCTLCQSAGPIHGQRTLTVGANAHLPQTHGWQSPLCGAGTTTRARRLRHTTRRCVSWTTRLTWYARHITPMTFHLHRKHAAWPARSKLSNPQPKASGAAETAYNIGVYLVDAQAVERALSWFEAGFQALGQAPPREAPPSGHQSNPLNADDNEEVAADEPGGSLLQRRIVRCMAWCLLQLGHPAEAEKRLSLTPSCKSRDTKEGVIDACLALEICCRLPSRHADIAQRASRGGGVNVMRNPVATVHLVWIPFPGVRNIFEKERLPSAVAQRTLSMLLLHTAKSHGGDATDPARWAFQRSSADVQASALVECMTVAAMDEAVDADSLAATVTTVSSVEGEW